MQMKRILIVCSNHDPKSWTNEQRNGWDEIYYIPFPNIPSQLTTKELRQLLLPTIVKLREFEIWNGNRYAIYFNIQGEFAATYLLQHALFRQLAFPTTERVVIEEEQADGTLKKTAIFKFIAWRIINSDSSERESIND